MTEPQGEPPAAALDAAYKAFREHGRKQEFNDLGEMTCSECGYAFAWPGPNGRMISPPRRRERHFAREALHAAAAVVTEQGEN